MTPDHLRESAVLIGGGLGLLIAAVALLARGRRGWVGMGLAAAGAGGVGAALFDSTAGWLAAGLTAAPTAAAWVFGTGRPAAVLAARRSPAVRAGGMVVVGLALVAGAVIRNDAQHQERLDTDTDWVTRIGEQPDIEPARSDARTDRGHRLDLGTAVRPRPAALLRAREADLLADVWCMPSSFRRGPADDACNCHGWVFTGGRHWVGPGEVRTILAENGYAPVTAPRPGDLAVYRLGGEITHTAVVRVAEPGLPVLVEGKWGWLGVYLHPADASNYGKGVTYYRSPRSGHLLAGLAPVTSAPGPVPEEGL